MKIGPRILPPQMPAALNILINGDELTSAILAYLAGRNISIIGPLKIIVGGERLHSNDEALIMLDSSAELIITE